MLSKFQELFVEIVRSNQIANESDLLLDVFLTLGIFNNLFGLIFQFLSEFVSF
jgi:hypothetical protein